MKGKTYSKKDLIDAYIEVNEATGHEDFRKDAELRLAALCKAFGISLEFPGVYQRQFSALWFIFRASASNYSDLRTPRQTFTEDTLITHQLEADPEVNERLSTLESDTVTSIQQARTDYLNLINALFDVLWQIEDKELSSLDLYHLGYDDSKRPRKEDYWD